MRGRVIFQAGGTERQLRFTSNRVCLLEERLGRSFLGMIEEMQGGTLRFSDIRSLFWAGLDGDPTMEEAGDLMDDVGITVAGELIGKAFEAWMPDLEADADEKKQPAAA